jgi:hypothetical protein
MPSSITAPGGREVFVAFTGASTEYSNVAGVSLGGADRTLFGGGASLPAGGASLGELPAGTEVGFWLRANGTGPRLSGDEFVRVTPSGGGFSVAFEDQQADAAANPNRGPRDGDFDDLVLSVRFEAEAVDWDALAARVNANRAATGQWSGGDPATWPTRQEDPTDWDALAAQAAANFAATGQWFV